MEFFAPGRPVAAKLVGGCGLSQSGSKGGAEGSGGHSVEDRPDYQGPHSGATGLLKRNEGAGAKGLANSGGEGALEVVFEKVGKVLVDGVDQEQRTKMFVAHAIWSGSATAGGLEEGSTDRIGERGVVVDGGGSGRLPRGHWGLGEKVRDGVCGLLRRGKGRFAFDNLQGFSKSASSNAGVDLQRLLLKGRGLGRLDGDSVVKSSPELSPTLLVREADLGVEGGMRNVFGLGVPMPGLRFSGVILSLIHI